MYMCVGLLSPFLVHATTHSTQVCDCMLFQCSPACQHASLQGLLWCKTPGVPPQEGGGTICCAMVAETAYYAGRSMFMADRQFYSADPAGNLYNALAYFVATTAANTLVTIANGLIITLIVYSMAGERPCEGCASRHIYVTCSGKHALALHTVGCKVKHAKREEEKLALLILRCPDEVK